MRLLLLFFTLSTCYAIMAQSADLSKLDELLNKFERRSQLMGSIAFSENGETTYAKAIGFSEVSSQTKADTSTKYRIGSVSKMYTATMILQLAEEEKLNLSHKLSRFFPTLPNAHKITIENLLHHQSGIYNFGKSNDEKYRKLNPQNREQIIKAFENAPPAFLPGKNVDYNNANYVLLSLIIEEIDQSTFAESLEKRIIQPLALKSTHAGSPIEVSQNEAHSYFWKKNWQKNADHFTPTLMGAGAIVSTPKDVNIFLEALFSEQFMAKDYLNKMLSLKENMGLGIYQFPFYNKTAYGHSGDIDSFESFSVYFPEEKIAFTMLLNANRKEVNEILIECLQAYFGL